MLRRTKVLVGGEAGALTNLIAEGLRNDEMMQIVGRAYSFEDIHRKVEMLRPEILVLYIGAWLMDDVENFVTWNKSEKAVRLIVICNDRITSGRMNYLGAHDVLLRDAQTMSDSRKLLQTLGMKLHASIKSIGGEVSPAVAMPGSHFRTAFRGVIALGASTGGTEATYKVVKDLPPNLPGMVIVQHMPPDFTKLYAQRLDRTSNLHVREAQNLDLIEAGTALIAPGDRHMRVIMREGRYFAECFTADRVNGHRPSVDVLFDSVAAVAGKNSVGIILTGMGGDGGAGLLKMRHTGAYTIGQDEKSCVVYGMPKVAFDLGAVKKQAPLDDIAGILLQHLATAR